MKARVSLWSSGIRNWTRYCFLPVPTFVACGGVLEAQETDSLPSAEVTFPALSLEQVLDVTLEHSVPLQHEILQRRAREGELRATSGAFDSRFTTSVSRGHDVRAGVPSSPQDGPPVQRNTTAYAVGLQKTFRSGITIVPQIQVNHLAVDAVTPYSIASVSLDLVVPLLRDRGGSVIRSSEMTLARLLEADTHAYRHAQATALFAALAAYWRYTASVARLDVQRASAQRARDLVRETEVLVEAGERPPADLNHVQGNLAVKRAAVLAVEQIVVASRGYLGLVMGLPSEQALRLGPPLETLPPPVQTEARDPLRQFLVTLALRNRADLAAASDRTAAGAVVAEAALQATRRGFNLSLSTGYTGTGQGLATILCIARLSAMSEVSTCRWGSSGMHSSQTTARSA